MGKIKSSNQHAVVGIFVLFFLLGLFGSWGTHIWRCLTEEQWGFLIAGAIMFPIAVVHGVGIWFGVW